MNVFTKTMLLVLLVCGTASPDWLGFRGSDASGVADSTAPTKCDESTIAWSVDLPGRGVSSPIVVGGQVIVTSSIGINRDRLHVVSVDVNSGERRWHRQFWATGRTMCNPTSAIAAPSPVSDGENIVAFFSSNDVVCLGMDGDLKWFRGLAHDNPKAGNDVGMASSPVLARGVVVCQVENFGDSFVEGIDVKDGTMLWHIDRPKASNWTSPIFLPGETDMVLLKSGQSVSAHDLRTGDMVWEVTGEVGGIPTMAATDDRIYVPGSTFLALDKQPQSAQVAWDSKTIRPGATPIVTNDRFYMVNSAGVLSSNSTEDGSTQWQVRVGGKYWASPVMAGDFIYAVNQAGDLHIVEASSGRKVDSHDFAEDVFGTPAVSDGALFIRSTARLFKVASP